MEMFRQIAPAIVAFLVGWLIGTLAAIIPEVNSHRKKNHCIEITTKDRILECYRDIPKFCKENFHNTEEYLKCMDWKQEKK